MDRSRRLYDLWTWLVPFRVVAETESLPAAAELLRVAPSALSRSVRLLEERLEVALFDRRSNRLMLNPAGQRLLVAIRTGMRVIDDGIVDLAHPDVRSVRIGCPGELLPLLIEPLGELLTEPVPIVAAIDELPDASVVAPLQRGLIDIALASSHVDAGSLVVRRLAGLPRGVFVGATARAVDPTGLRYAVPLDREGAARDGFPPAHARSIGLRVRHGGAILEAVRSGSLAAVLPLAVGRRAGFVQVEPALELAPLDLSLVTRVPVASWDVAEHVVDRLIGSLMRA